MYIIVLFAQKNAAYKTMQHSASSYTCNLLIYK